MLKSEFTLEKKSKLKTKSVWLKLNIPLIDFVPFSFLWTLQKNMGILT
jgi:hypothetical protein